MDNQTVAMLISIAIGIIMCVWALIYANYHRAEEHQVGLMFLTFTACYMGTAALFSMYKAFLALLVFMFPGVM